MVSLTKLVRMTPEDGCLLIFNGNPQQVYNAVSTTGYLKTRKIVFGKFFYDERAPTTDMYVVYRE